MLKGVIDGVYEELEKKFGLSRREGQRVGSTYFSLLFYSGRGKGRVTNVIGEGQTGMGKTISYLVPVALAKAGMLPEIPKFVLEDADYFMRKEDEDELTADFVSERGIEEVSGSSGALRKVKPNIGRAYLVTATKMLQNQVVNRDLRVINEYLKKKGKKLLNHAVFVGKRNFLCLKNVKRILSRLEEEIERLEEEIGKGSVKDEAGYRETIGMLKELSGYLREIEEKELTSFDAVLKEFGFRKYSRFIELLEDEAGKDAISPDRGFLGTRIKEILRSVENTRSLISTVGTIKMRGFFFKPKDCRLCAWEHKCEFYQASGNFDESDVYVMNYYYFASVFLEFLGNVSRAVRSIEEKLGIPWYRWGNNEETKKATDELFKEAVKEGAVEVNEKNFISGLIYLKSIYEEWVRNAVFIFDEAHVFERDMLSANMETVDLREIKENVEKILKKLREINEVLEFIGIGGIKKESTESLFLEAVSESYWKLEIFNRVLKGVEERVREMWDRGMSLDVGDYGLVFLDEIYGLRGKEGISPLIKEEIDEILKMAVNLVKADRMDKKAGRKTGDSKAEKFLSKLGDALAKWRKGGLSEEEKAELKVVGQFIFREVIDSIGKEVAILGDATQEVRKKYRKGEEIIPVVHSCSRKLPVSRIRALGRQLGNVFWFSRWFLSDYLGKLEVMDYVTYSSVLDGKFLGEALTGEKNWREKVRKITGSSGGRVAVDGFVWNMIRSDVESMIKEHLPEWVYLRKVFTSATILDDVSRLSEGAKGCAGYFLRSVGLRGANEDSLEVFVVRSPFNLEENALMYVPEDLPDVVGERGVSDEWKEYVLEKMKELPFYARGGVLVLLTSRELLWFLYRNLKSFYEREGVEVFAQGINSVKEINERFGRFGEGDERKKQVLFSVNLYWQGFDVPGEGLQHVIIPKLPFDEPNSPYNVMIAEREMTKLAKYLMEKKGVGPLRAAKIAERWCFKKMTLPRAVLLFRQGMGRLIRSENDRGIITVLDRRLIESGYSENFLNTIRMPLVRKLSDVARFLEKHGIKENLSSLRRVPAVRMAAGM